MFKNPLRNIQLSSKVLLSNLLPIALVAILSVVSFLTLRTYQDSSLWVSHTYQVLSNAAHIENLLIEIETNEKAFIITGDESFIEQYAKSRYDINKKVEETKILVSDNPPQVVRMSEIMKLINLWFDKSLDQEVVTRQKVEQDQTLIQDVTKLIIAGPGKQILKELKSKLQVFSNVERQLMIIRESKAQNFAKYANLVIVLGAILIIILTLAFYYLIQRLIKKQLQETVVIADKITEGKYDVSIEPKHAQDYLNIALKRMANALKTKSADLSIEKEKIERDDWIKTNQNSLNNKLQGLNKPYDFANIFLQNMIKILEAKLGLFYITKNIEAEPYLSLIATYAYKEQKSISNRFALGESLVGQCALEKQYIIVEQVPEDYLAITSGLGSTANFQILLVPIIFEGNVLGVLELGSLHKFTDLHKEFIKYVIDSIGVILNNIQSSSKTKSLLEKFKIISNELQEKQRETEKINQELTVKSKKLEKQQHDLLNAKQEIEEKAAQLEKISSYKSEFLANMSHELRTPLNSLLILSQCLANNEEQNLTSEQVDDCKTINQSGKELLTLINDILDLSKVEAGKIEIITNTLDVKFLLEDLKAQFKPIVQSKQLTFTTNIEPEFPLHIISDEKRLRQILKNLLSNAFKFSNEGNVSLSAQKSGFPKNQIAFIVQDQGVGIPEDKLCDIFKAFEQADKSTSKNFQGTGLGLAISSQLTNLMGGEITVSSKENEGSIFTLILPYNDTLLTKKKPTPETTPKSIPTNVPTTNTILIVEDDKTFANILARQAKAHNYNYFITDSGEEGINFAVNHQPVAICLDLGLPDISGEEVLLELHKNSKSRSIPVHIISSSDFDLRFIEKGAITFLQKPVTSTQIDQVFTNIKTAAHQEIKHCLIVEDDKTTQKVLSRLLKSQDLKISLASSASKAKNEIMSQKVDLIILDLGLPDISGYELIKSLFAEHGNLPPIIVYTAKLLTSDEFTELSKFASHIFFKSDTTAEQLTAEVNYFLTELKANKHDTFEEHIYKNSDIKDSPDSKILICDTDMRNLFTLSGSLTNIGLQVKMSKNYTEAIDVLSKNTNIKLLIINLEPAELNNKQTFEQLRQNDHCKNLPIIILTKDIGPEERKMCIKNGATACFNKPIDTNKLITAITSYLNIQGDSV